MIAKRAKYGNRKVEFEGITFDSKKEMQRYVVLRQAEADGIITDLTLQPQFELIPKVTETYIKHLKTKDKLCERTVQLPIYYKGDFQYSKDGVTVVEDVKASKFLLDQKFVIKEKLFRWKFGFSIKRVFKPNEAI